MLWLKNINVVFGKDTKLSRQVLFDLNITVEDGEFLVIIGSNGAGKSTIFNVISGIVAQESGHVEIDGQNISGILGRERAEVASRVEQDPKAGTMENMTIMENMCFAYMRGRRRFLKPYKNHEREEFFKEKLSLLGMGLEDRLSSIVRDLSGGQRQALSLIMSVLSDSRILLLDEITAALDPKSADLVMRTASEIVQHEKKTSIMITHNMSHAINYGDRLVLLSHGRIVGEFSAKEKARFSPCDLAAKFNEL